MNDNVGEAPQSEVTDFRKRKRRVLFWLVITVILNAAFDVGIDLPYHDVNFAIFATTGLAAFFAFAWVQIDARERGLDLIAWGAAMALLTKFALPAYFIVSRGWRRGLLANLLTALLLSALLAVYMITVELTLLAMGTSA